MIEAIAHREVIILKTVAAIAHNKTAEMLM